jgi:hypothetical protein
MSGNLVAQRDAVFREEPWDPIMSLALILSVRATRQSPTRALRDLKHDANRLSFTPPFNHGILLFSKRHAGAPQPVVALRRPRSLTSWCLCDSRLLAS